MARTHNIEGFKVEALPAHFENIMHADYNGVPHLVLNLSSMLGPVTLALCPNCVKALKDCLDTAVEHKPDFQEE